jgi:hypothetical protein
MTCDRGLRLQKGLLPSFMRVYAHAYVRLFARPERAASGPLHDDNPSPADN